MLRRVVKRSLRRFGLELRRIQPPTDTGWSLIYDQPDWIRSIVKAVKPYTMTSQDRIVALCNAVQHVVRNKVPGDFVECGVWRGGSMMAAALALKHLGDTSRHLWLYDTFKGMPPPSDADVRASDNRTAASILAESALDSPFWAIASIEDVAANMRSVGYANVHLIEGMVEDTIPAKAPKQISLLRLDTDWYESTKHELIHLYPRLSLGGALIIDDYGFWRGQRKAIDEYIAKEKLSFFLHRIDDAGSIAIKS
jgi:O-methyltransferase